MSTLRADVDHQLSCRMRSYFSASPICLDRRGWRARRRCRAPRSCAAFRSSWNSRRLRCRSRSWSTSSRWRRACSASDSVGRVACRASRPGAPCSAALWSFRSFSRLRELGFELGLRRLGRLGFAQHAIAVDVADLQFLRLGRQPRSTRQQASSRANSNFMERAFIKTRYRSGTGSAEFYRSGFCADRQAVAELERAHRRRSSSGPGRPRRAGVPRVDVLVLAPRRCRRRRRRTGAGVLSLSAPGHRHVELVVDVAASWMPPMKAPVTSTGRRASPARSRAPSRGRRRRSS